MLERARKDGAIGSALEGKLELTVPAAHPIAAYLQQLAAADDLCDVLSVSQCRVVEEVWSLSLPLALALATNSASCCDCCTLQRSDSLAGGSGDDSLAWLVEDSTAFCFVARAPLSSSGSVVYVMSRRSPLVVDGVVFLSSYLTDSLPLCPSLSLSLCLFLCLRIPVLT